MTGSIVMAYDAIDPHKVDAQTLRCGDVIDFDGNIYAVLLTFTDTRHEQTIIPCWKMGESEVVSCLRVYKLLPLSLVGRCSLSLNVIDTDLDGFVTEELSALNPIDHSP